jgi:protein-S-isoprenylcysteine O-methyltransferase Ste14
MEVTMTNTDSVSNQPARPHLDKYGYNSIGRHIGTGVFTAVLLFLGAGTLDWAWGWAYSIVTMLGWIGLSAVLAQENPELLNERGKRARQAVGTKRWDWVILGIYTVLVIVIHFIAGLDYHEGWTAPVSPLVHIAGLVLLAVSFALLTWGMAANRFFEPTVRIQNNRNHQVTTGGPYRYLRHPGYAGVIVQFIATPLALGSNAAWIPALIGIVLFVIRTALEDQVLQRELPGYADYARQTRFRLLPGVW